MGNTLEDLIRSVVHQVLESNNSLAQSTKLTRSKPIIAANWKMNMTIAKAKDFFEQLQHSPYNYCETIICPSYPLLYPLIEDLGKHGIALGAQNVHEEEKGAYTGEVQIDLLKEMNCTYVIVGHSERRQQGESDEQIKKKIEQVALKSLTPIICIGETKKERDQGKTKEIIKDQLEAALCGIPFGNRNFIIAYEPVWAIGTGETSSPNEAQKIHKFIRGLLAEKLNQAISNEIPLLYGGSVKGDNIKELYRMEDIDGALVGGASLSAESFEAIITALQ